MATTTARTARARPAQPRRRRWPRRILGLLAALVVLCALLLGIGWVATPSVGDAADRVAAQLAAHSAPVLRGAVPERMASAVIATEDSRFRDNPGVDPVSVVRAPLTLFRTGDLTGATLEQQLAKNLYEGGRTDVLAKGAEAVLALKLDHSWSKADILRMYLDDGYYGHGFYGLTDASEGYFGVRPDALSWAQASLLAGLFQAPSAYDPFVHPDVARARQAHVLDRLVAIGALSRSEADRVAAQPWGLRGR